MPQTKKTRKMCRPHLRHTDIGTTMSVYTQAIPESVRKLVNAMADDVMGSALEPATGRIQQNFWGF